MKLGVAIRFVLFVNNVMLPLLNLKTLFLCLKVILSFCCYTPVQTNNFEVFMNAVITDNSDIIFTFICPENEFQPHTEII